MPHLLQEMAGRWCHQSICLVLTIVVYNISQYYKVLRSPKTFFCLPSEFPGLWAATARPIFSFVADGASAVAAVVVAAEAPAHVGDPLQPCEVVPVVGSRARTETYFILVKSAGLVVMGGDSCPEGRGFKS